MYPSQRSEPPPRMLSHILSLKLSWNSASVWSSVPGSTGAGCVGVRGALLTSFDHTTGRM